MPSGVLCQPLRPCSDREEVSGRGCWSEEVLVRKSHAACPCAAVLLGLPGGDLAAPLAGTLLLLATGPSGNGALSVWYTRVDGSVDDGRASCVLNNACRKAAV